MVKKKWLITFMFLLISLVMILLSLMGCQRESYEAIKYTKEEIMNVYRNNEELFTRLATTLVTEENFYSEGRVYEYADADITTPYDEEIDLFSEIGKQTIYEFFEFRPYMLEYEEYQQYAEITFMGREGVLAFTFVYWIDGQAYEEDEMPRRISDRKDSLEGVGHVVEPINDYWWIYWIEE